MKLSALTAAFALLIVPCAFADPAPPAATTSAAAPAGSPTLDDFYANPVFDSAKLSPDGHRLAYVQTLDTSVVMVKDLDTGDIKPIINANVKGVTVDWLQWKDDNRLILGLTLLDIKRRGDKPNGDVESFKYGQFLMAIDRDGKNTLQLLKSNSIWNQNRGSMVSLLDRLKRDPDHILATAPDSSGDDAIWRVNIRTGEAVNIEKGSDTVSGWRTDSTGAVVVRYRVIGRSLIIEGRATDADPWSKIATVRSKDLKALDDFEIEGAAEKPSQFYVTVKPKDQTEGDVRRLRIYDIATKTLSEPVWPALKYDISDIVYDGESSRLAAVCYTTDVAVCDFANKTTMANFKGLLNYFGGDRNITPISFSGDGDWWLLDVSGPDEPSSYYLYNKSAAKIELVAERYQKVADANLGVMQRYAYVSRDGVQIPAYLTRPRNAPPGPLPLIVMPHGGPEVRDSLEYDVWSQYLATRGYLVFQPNYRGSSGYGVSFAESGYKQWGGRMADDVTDGVKALIASGQVDPNRICIFGASFGGYAALYAGATQYRGAIQSQSLRNVLKHVDTWYARYEEDARLYGEMAKETVHLGDWLIDAFPMANAELDEMLTIGDEVWGNQPLDRTIQHIQRYKTVHSPRIHPLLCALTSAQTMAFTEQRGLDGVEVSGKFRSMLFDIFGRTYPENTLCTFDREKVRAYKAKVNRSIEGMRENLHRVLA